MRAPHAPGFATDGVEVWRGGLRPNGVSAIGVDVMDFFERRLHDSGLVTDARRDVRGLERIFDLQSELPQLSALWHEGQLLERAATLLDVELVRVFYTQAIVKYPAPNLSDRARGVVGWHKDFAYWQGAHAPRMMTAWIPFTETSPDLGGLQYAQGSHLDAGPATKGFNNTDLEVLDATAQIVSPTLSIGDVAFHHCLTTHASAPNRGAAPRLAVAVHLMDAALAPIDLSRCHPSLAFLRESDPSLVH